MREAEGSRVLLMLKAAGEAPPWRDWLHADLENDALKVEIPIRKADGDDVLYHLVITFCARGTELELLVQEDPSHPRRLPGACPERHINQGGGFCLSWSPDGPQVPSDLASASTWWGLVAGFLDLQHRAEDTRMWPQDRAWAHGDAARIQHQIEQLSSGLPRAVFTASLRVRPRGDGLLRERREQCACGKKRQYRRCHERELIELLRLRRELQQQENAFWEGWKGRPCCGLMDGCRLAQ